MNASCQPCECRPLHVRTCIHAACCSAACGPSPMHTATCLLQTSTLAHPHECVVYERCNLQAPCRFRLRAYAPMHSPPGAAFRVCCRPTALSPVEYARSCCHAAKCLLPGLRCNFPSCLHCSWCCCSCSCCSCCCGGHGHSAHAQGVACAHGHMGPCTRVLATEIVTSSVRTQSAYAAGTSISPLLICRAKNKVQGQSQRACMWVP